MSNLSQAKENLRIERERLKKYRAAGDKNGVRNCQGNIAQWQQRVKDLQKLEKTSGTKKTKKTSSSGSSRKGKASSYSSGGNYSGRSSGGSCLMAPFKLLWWIIKLPFTILKKVINLG